MTLEAFETRHLVGRMRTNLRSYHDGYSVIRVFLATLLLVAAASKGYQLATEPTANSSPFTNRAFLGFVVEAELLFGFWLLSNVLPRKTWLLSIGVFSTFGVVSLYKVLEGADSCGCFGSVPFHPWVTFIIDVFAVVVLLRFPPVVEHIPGQTNRTKAALATVGFGWTFVGGVAAIAMGSYVPNKIDENGGFTSSGDLVLLQPEEWKDSRFPLLPHIESSANLAAGEWIVVLYHHDCPKCQENLPRYSQLAHDLKKSGAKPRIALVEVPPYGDHRHEDDGASFYGRLHDSKEWFVEAPVEIHLNQSIVVNASKELDFLCPYPGVRHVQTEPLDARNPIRDTLRTSVTR